ncbi:host attachment protein [Salinisphaera sp. Q1T1-3]|uniref:baeRF12 domain-containing protein n=1 Tax=Salinisphaera sp. Q1T1-3 TaxID=2321229 RepID=UPI000E713D67|nr:host attachment family protein [Salinisphaera sp. Q1T1-3]RJS91403.1 host attachment protein [Salinisphaera sp. Q1T1-3]
MATQWIIVADAAAARFFSRTPDGALERIGADYHEESRLHEGDLRTGGKGEVHDAGGAGQRQSDPQTRTSEKHADIFAKQVAEKLKSASNDNAFDELVLVAAPSFLGHLRDKLDNTVSKRIVDTIDKDWTQHDDEQIAKQLNTQIRD